jgi:hypothetical protein
MMRHLFTAVAALVIAGSCEAGTITKSNVDHKVSVKETYANGVRSTTLKFTLTTSVEADLTKGETAGFSPDTLIQASFPLGPSASFSLAEDPEYVPGDTSVKVTRSTIFNSVLWKLVVNMRWDGNKLKLTAKATASQQFDKPALIEWEAVPKTKTKRTSNTNLLVSLLADNADVEFLNLGIEVPVTIKTVDTLETKPNGTTKRGANQSIKGRIR